MEENIKESLGRFLSTALQANSVQVVRAALLSGGAVQENWLLDLQITGGPFDGMLNTVLRCDSPTAGVAISHGRAQEFALLSTVYAAGVTVPQPLWLCEDLSVCGRPFFIMRRIRGTAAGHRATTPRLTLARRLDKPCPGPASWRAECKLS